MLSLKKNELTGIVGRTFIGDQGVKNVSLSNNNLHFGNGLTTEINYGHFLMAIRLPNLTLEVPVVVDWDQDLQFAANSAPGNYRSYFVTPSLRANALATTGVSPWVSFGSGVGQFSPSSELEFGEKKPNGGSTNGMPNLAVDTGKSRQHNINVGGGVVWQF